MRALGAILMRFGTGRTARVAAIAASICLLLTLAPGLSAESTVTVSVSTVPTSIKLYRNLYAGATVDTNAADIRPTADGGAVAVGVTTSPAGYPVGWVLKLDASGNAQWSEDVGAAFTYPSSVEPTGDGGVVLAGGTQGGSGAVCDPLSGRECAWVAKLGPGGAVEWQRVYATGTSTLQVAWDIRQTTDDLKTVEKAADLRWAGELPLSAPRSGEYPRFAAECSLLLRSGRPRTRSCTCSRPGSLVQRR